MRPNTRFDIAVLPGDGIGHAFMPPCLEVLRVAVGQVARALHERALAETAA
jgi:hypothetical protein